MMQGSAGILLKVGVAGSFGEHDSTVVSCKHRWTYPKVDLASVEEGRSSLGGLAGKRQKTRLEEEMLLVTSRVRRSCS